MLAKVDDARGYLKLALLTYRQRLFPQTKRRKTPRRQLSAHGFSRGYAENQAIPPCLFSQPSTIRSSL